MNRKDRSWLCAVILSAAHFGAADSSVTLLLFAAITVVAMGVFILRGPKD